MSKNKEKDSEKKKSSVRVIETYVREHKLPPKETRPSLNEKMADNNIKTSGSS